MKFSFRKIDQKDVLLLYPLELKLIKSIFYFDNTEINIKYIPKTLIKYFRNFFFDYISLRNSYFNTIIEQVNPILALGHDLDGRIIKFKKYFPKKIAMMFQFAAIQEIWRKNFYKTWGKKKIDFFVVFNKSSYKKFKSIKKLECKYLFFGSLKNNQIYVKNKKKKYDLMFISDYRDIASNKIEIINQEYNKLLLEAIADYCIQRKKKIIVALVSNRKDKKKFNFFKNLNFRLKEKNYYQNISKVFQFNKMDSYECMSQSKCAINSASTLGYELMSRNIKVYFLDGIYKIKKKTKKVNRKKIFKDLDNILNIKKNFFINQKFKENLIIYDKNNNKFQKYLKKLIHERKKSF